MSYIIRTIFLDNSDGQPNFVAFDHIWLTKEIDAKNGSIIFTGLFLPVISHNKITSLIHQNQLRFTSVHMCFTN